MTRDIGDFASHAEGFLAERLERNVMASILASLRAGDSFGSAAPLFAYALDPADALDAHRTEDPPRIARDEHGTPDPGDLGGPVVAAAMRTPPWPLVATGFGDAPAATELMRAWLAEDPDVGGINAETETARAVASAWAQLTGGSTRQRMTEAMHALTAVGEPPRPARGALREAREADRALLIGWERAFVSEAGVGIAQQAPQRVDRRLASAAQFVWEDSGPVSTVAIAPVIAGTVRIGPVYTPPAQRGRGYATSAVAALSRQMLSRDAQRCMLFTDLTNPTSNKIYASIGYRRFASWEEHAFIVSRSRSRLGGPRS